MELLKEIFGLETEPAMTTKEWIIGTLGVIGLMLFVVMTTVLIWAMN